MKSNLIRIFFEWALIASVLMSAGFCTWYSIKSRVVRASEGQMANAQAHVQNNQAFLNQLGAECQEYGKTNADMTRLLATFTKPAAGPAAVAPAKSTTR